MSSERPSGVRDLRVKIAKVHRRSAWTTVVLRAVTRGRHRGCCTTRHRPACRDPAGVLRPPSPLEDGHESLRHRRRLRNHLGPDPCLRRRHRPAPGVPLRAGRAGVPAAGLGGDRPGDDRAGDRSAPSAPPSSGSPRPVGRRRAGPDQHAGERVHLAAVHAAARVPGHHVDVAAERAGRRGVARGRPRRADPQPDGPVQPLVLLRVEARVAAAHRPGGEEPGRPGRPRGGHPRVVAALPAHRGPRARHRRVERVALPVHGPQDPDVGRRAVRGARECRGRPCPTCGRGVPLRDHGPRRLRAGGADHRDHRGPAGGPVRPRLRGARRRQGDVRHLGRRRAEHRLRGGPARGPHRLRRLGGRVREQLLRDGGLGLPLGLHGRLAAAALRQRDPGDGAGAQPRWTRRTGSTSCRRSPRWGARAGPTAAAR